MDSSYWPETGPYILKIPTNAPTHDTANRQTGWACGSRGYVPSDANHQTASHPHIQGDMETQNRKTLSAREVTNQDAHREDSHTDVICVIK